MTMNYCGRCGAANGSAARYCRQCGAELHNQAAMSSSSTPLNVEFSARKDHQRDTRLENLAAVPHEDADIGKLSQHKATTGKVSVPTSVTTPQTNGEENKDPKAISESLKRIRASGPLVMGAVRKTQEQMSQIIAESVENKGDSKSDNKDGRNNDKNQGSKNALTAVQTQAAPSARTQLASSPNSQTTTMSQRRATGSLMSPASMRSTVSSGNGNNGQSPPHGPSSVLAQASGLGKNSNFGSKLRIGLIAAIVVISASGYFLLRDRLAVPSRLLDAGRNLKSVEEQSADLVKLAQRDREQGRYDTAIGYFQNALALTPNSLETRFLLAQTQLSARHIDDALRNYHAILRADAEHLEARLQIAEIHRTSGNWAAALPEYKRIIAFDQTTPQAAFALEAIETHESGKAQPDLALRRKGVVSKNSPVVNLPGGGLQADISLQPPRMAAVTGIKPPVANRPEDKPDPRVVADGHKKLGLRYYNVREYPAAIKEFLSAYRLNQEDKDLLYFIGSCYYGLEQFALAHDYFKKVDSGNYVGVAQSNAARTEKAAREESKRRELMKGDQLNQVKVDPNRKSKVSLNGTE